MPMSEANRRASKKYAKSKKGKECRRKAQQRFFARNVIKFHEYIATLYCHRCGLSFGGQPNLCNFHHPNDEVRSTKYGGYVSTMARLGAKTALRNELSVTIPLCKNCHHQVHADAP
jgi:RNase P subunit RPR2